MKNLILDHLEVWTAAQTPSANGGRGRGSNANGQSHGIKKLRELILELAVRGKLVPQDPIDEPASVLLEKIAKEKKWLIKEGKIKKEKPLPEISEGEKPFELPKGWEWARINDVGHDWGQKTPDNDFTYIEVSGIDNVAGVVKSPNILSAAQAPSRARKIIKTGTVIYSTVRPYLKNICVIDRDYSPEPIASTAFAILHPFQKMPGEYFALYLRSPIFVRYVESVQTGIAYPAINDRQFFGGVIPIPPLAEQHRIVAKVDELMAICDQLEQQEADSMDTHQTLVEILLSALTSAADQNEFANTWDQIAGHFDTLFTTEHSIDQLKQTILQLAVMGKLVPQDPNDEPASVLLEKIAKEKKGLIKEGKIKKEKPLPEIKEEEKPFELPEGWGWAQCQDICHKITDGEHATPRRSDSGHYLLSARNVTNEGILLNDVDFVPLDEFERIRKRCDPNIGDILISCSGSVGRVALVDRNEAYSMVRSAAMIRPDNSLLSKEFVALAMRSPFLQEQMVNRSRKTAQANLFLGAISKLVIAIPSLSEQHRIVAKVDELMAICDNIKTHLNAAQTTQIQLADAFTQEAYFNNTQQAN